MSAQPPWPGRSGPFPAARPGSGDPPGWQPIREKNGASAGSRWPAGRARGPGPGQQPQHADLRRAVRMVAGRGRARPRFRDRIADSAPTSARPTSSTRPSPGSRPPTPTRPNATTNPSSTLLPQDGSPPNPACDIGAGPPGDRAGAGNAGIPGACDDDGCAGQPGRRSGAQPGSALDLPGPAGGRGGLVVRPVPGNGGVTRGRLPAGSAVAWAVGEGPRGRGTGGERPTAAARGSWRWRDAPAAAWRPGTSGPFPSAR